MRDDKPIIIDGNERGREIGKSKMGGKTKKKGRGREIDNKNNNVNSETRKRKKI